MKSPLILVFLALPSTAFSAANFDGCKGLTVTRSKDFSQVDVSADLKKAEKRINDLCKKVIPNKLKAIDANAKSCMAGSAVDTGAGIAGEMASKVKSQMYAFDQRVKEACDSMKKTIEESKSACDTRKSTLTKLNGQISTLDKAESDQTSSLKNVAGLYGSAVSVYESTSKAAGEAKQRIYAKLPDKDENRGQQMRTGQEGASTADSKTDKLIADWKATLSELAKDNKKRSACVKLAANGGQLDEMGNILKNNLWPNGKVAARAMSRIESADKEKAAEFGGQKAEAEKRANNAKMADEYSYGYQPGKGSDISGTEEGLVKQTPEQLSELNAKANKSAELTQETAEICQKQGGCQTESAVMAAFKAAKESEAGPVGPVEYPVQKAVSGNILGGQKVVDQPGILDDLERTPAAVPVDTYKAPDVPCVESVWGWFPPGYTTKMGFKNAANECIFD